MPQHDGFLQAIREAPEDDTPRLVYADWLEENGEADRAEFIRTQCALASLPKDDPRRPVLVARERELLEIHKRAWLGHLTALGADSSRYRAGWWFQRGFVEEVEIKAVDFVANAAAVLAVAPVLSGLCLQEVRDHLPALGACPQLGQTSRLKFLPEPEGMWGLRHAGLGTADLEAFFASPHLGRLTSFDLSFHHVDAGGARALAKAATLTGLTTLDLSSCVAVGDEGAAALAASANLAHLTHLELGDSPTWPDSPGNRIGDAGAAVLADSLHLSGLRKLGLGFNRIGDAGARALAESLTLAALVDLDLGNNAVGEEGLRALIESAGLTSLEALGLANNPAGPPEEYFYDEYGTLADARFDRGRLAEITARFRRPLRIY
jgi:uncharacterized protein (TIGR02996 family)